MKGFFQALEEQRWDDHRYYHHSRINQALHLVSAISFPFHDIKLYHKAPLYLLRGEMFDQGPKEQHG